MVDIDMLVEKVVSMVASTCVTKATDTLAEVTKNAFQSLRKKGILRTDEIQKLSDVIRDNPPSMLDLQRYADTLSRWFEIPRDEFEKTPVDRLQTDVLVRHVYLEHVFEAWLDSHGYQVAIGEKMLGLEGWEFIPDIFATLNTIHGRFQIAVNFVCQDPPSAMRVTYVLESLEAFAKKWEPEFSAKDIFMVVTPLKFTAAAATAITKEDKDHDYFVVKVEGTELSLLMKAENTQSRLKIFQGIVKDAYGPSGKKTWI